MALDISTLADLMLIPILFFVLAKRYPEAYYRIAHVKYRLHYEIGPDGAYSRQPIKASAVKHRSPAMYSTKHGDWIVGGPEYTIFSKGRPGCEYNYDDARPRRRYGEGDAKIPPSLIMAGYDNDSIERTHGMGKPKLKASTALIIFLLILILMAVAGTLYYEQNIACATHSAACVVTR